MCIELPINIYDFFINSNNLYRYYAIFHCVLAKNFVKYIVFNLNTLFYLLLLVLHK